MEATTKDKQPQDDSSVEEAFSIMLAELDKSVKDIKSEREDVLGTWVADI